MAFLFVVFQTCLDKVQMKKPIANAMSTASKVVALRPRSGSPKVIQERHSDRTVRQQGGLAGKNLIQMWDVG